MDKQFTDSQVEWAAECLCSKHYSASVWPIKDEYARVGWRRSALHALEHGYVPPPRPKTAREQLTDVACQAYASIFSGEVTGHFSVRVADALLARWPGIARVIEEGS